MNSDRFRFFTSVHHESDLLIGITHHCYFPALESVCREEQLRIYSLLSEHIAKYPGFASSLDPLQVPPGRDRLAPELESMYHCSSASGTGPMSSVAGLFAENTGRSLRDAVIQRFAPDVAISCEVLVENGGDLYLRNVEKMVVVIHAGNVPLSGKLGLEIPPGEWGICTSSGTLGHSFSRGKADALTIVSRNTPLADAWATALANQVKGKEDIPALLERVGEIDEILACVVIVDGELGIRGEFEMKLLSSDL